jgi:hypothetical protein
MSSLHSSNLRTIFGDLRNSPQDDFASSEKEQIGSITVTQPSNKFTKGLGTNRKSKQNIIVNFTSAFHIPSRLMQLFCN